MNLDYSKLISMPLEHVYAEGQNLDEPTPIHDELTRDRRSVDLQLGDRRAAYAAQQLDDAAGDAINLTKPTLIPETKIEDRRDHREPADIFAGLIEIAAEHDDADEVAEQWAWWKKWALLLAVGAVLAIIGYGWLVQA